MNELYVSTEFTIAETIAPTAYTWGYLAASNTNQETNRLTAPATDTKTIASTIVLGIENSIIDLRSLDFDGDRKTNEPIQAVFNAESFTDYDNTISFYEVKDVSGTVIDQETEEALNPCDPDYARVALSQRVKSLDMNRETGSLMVELETDQILALVLIANATPEQALQSSSALGESVLFAYKAAIQMGLSM